MLTWRPMRGVHSVEFSITIVHSKEGGEISHDRDATIQRIATFVDEVVRKQIPEDHLCSLVLAVRK